MREEFRPAIAALQSDLRDIERKGAETKRAINRLCELAGAPPMYESIDVESRPNVTTLRSDQFYGKVLNTASREYLEIRKAANLGPAAPREIYEALIAGGFKFETKSEANAMTILRQVLRKNSSTFHRLPHGAYGLLAWYPNAKATRHDDDDAPEKRPSSKRQPKRVTAKPARTRKSNAARPARAPAPDGGPGLGPRILKALDDGSEWTIARLKNEAAGWGIPGLTEELAGRKLQGTLLSLNKKKLVESTGNGWRKASTQEAA